jgi:hypothetical protein
MNSITFENYLFVSLKLEYEDKLILLFCILFYLFIKLT